MSKMLVTGVDMVEIGRIERVVDRYGHRFLQRVYTPQEIAYCRDRVPQLSTRFAAKEAVMKALGTGVRGVRWRDIEVVRKRGHAPTIRLHQTALARAQSLGLRHLAVSLSHTQDHAIAFVVGESCVGSIPSFGD